MPAVPVWHCHDHGVGQHTDSKRAQQLCQNPSQQAIPNAASHSQEESFAGTFAIAQRAVNRQCLQVCAQHHRSVLMVYQDPLLAYLPDAKVRRRKKKRASLNEDFAVTQPETWHKQYQVYQDWRDTSPTLQCLKDNAVRFQQTCDAVKRGIQQAQSQIVDQVDSSRDAVVVALKQQLKSARAKLRRALQQQQQNQQTSEDLGADLIAFSKFVSGSKQESQNFAIGSLVFAALAFVCGCAPWLLPQLYLVFAAVALPWRVYQFYRKRLSFYLLDFCYVRCALCRMLILGLLLLM